MKRTVMYVAGSVIFLLVLLWAGLALKQRGEAGQQLNEQAASQAILAQYPGEVLSLTLQDGKYLAELETEQGIYELWLSASTGEIFSIIQLEQKIPPASAAASPSPADVQPSATAAHPSATDTQPASTPAQPSATAVNPSATATQPASTPVQPSATARPAATPTPRRAVTREAAIRLALQEVPGESDDVETGEDRAGAFYLVEVNTADGREAVVQVNATSGAIMSVTWEDDKDDDT